VASESTGETLLLVMIEVAGEAGVLMLKLLDILTYSVYKSVLAMLNRRPTTRHLLLFEVSVSGCGEGDGNLLLKSLKSMATSEHS